MNVPGPLLLILRLHRVKELPPALHGHRGGHGKVCKTEFVEILI